MPNINKFDIQVTPEERLSDLELLEEFAEELASAFEVEEEKEVIVEDADKKA